MDIIIMFIEDNQIPYVVDVVGPKQRQKILKDLYEFQNVTRALYLNNKLHVLKVGGVGSVQNFIKNVKEIVTQLASIGKVVLDQEIMHIVLGGLPSYLESFQVITTQDELPSFDKLVSKLMLQEQQHDCLMKRDLTTKFCTCKLTTKLLEVAKIEIEINARRLVMIF